MFKNQTIWTRDNLDVLRGMHDECIDLIYLDPPFNSNRNYSAPIGSEAAGAAFKDTWTLSDVDNAWHGEVAEKAPAVYEAITASELTHGKAMKSYLIMMAVRLIEMKRILKPTGSIYLHCDPTASHYLKVLMDAVFGQDNFRNEIVWCYTGPSGSKKNFPAKHDLILRYSRSKTWVFNYNAVRVPYKNLNVQHKEEGSTGIGGKLTAEAVRLYKKAGKIPEDWWADISPVGRVKRERTGYPTQKPLALLKRIISASSNEGDFVLDQFCGCATALVAAEKLNRRWVGIDISGKAVDLVKIRMKKEANLFDRFEPVHRTDVPSRKGDTNYRDPEKKKFLYGSQEGKCNGCGVLFPYRNMTVDHIVARSKGGGDEVENLQLICGACNSVKGDRTQEYMIARLREQGIGKYGRF